MSTTRPGSGTSLAAANIGTRPPVPSGAPLETLGLRPPRDSEQGGEKLGLIEMMLARERYASILEIGCATGELAFLLAGRNGSYTGMDTDMAALAVARRRAVAGSPMRFVPLTSPLTLPRGEHQLVVLSEVLHLLDPAAVEHVAGQLAEHVPCEEIVVVGARDERTGERDAVLDAFVAALGEGFGWEELAMRRRYRIDALLRR